MAIELVEEATASDPPAVETASELVDRAEISNGTALVKFSKTEADLAQLRADRASMTFSMATTKDADLTRAFRKRCVSMRTTLKENCERLRAPAQDFRDAVIERQRFYTAEIAIVEKEADDVIKADESRRAAEKAAREQAEREEAARVQQCIDAIRDSVAGAIGKSAGGIAKFILLTEGYEITPAEFGDRAGEAAQVKQQTIAKLREMHAAAVTQEEDAARAKAQAEAERIERERVAAEQKAEAERLAAERKSLEAQQAALRSAQAKADKEAAAVRARADREAAAARAEQDRLAAEARAAEQRRLDVQAAELRAQREAQETKDRAAREAEEAKLRAERLAEQARIDAEAAEAARLAREQQEADERAAAAERQRVRDAEEAAAAAEKRGRDAWRLLYDALKSIENDDGRIPATIWRMRNEALAAATGEPA